MFIVLALIPKPELVFLDELTTGLDARARRSVWNFLEKLKKQGLSILLTSHFMDEIEALCDEMKMRICGIQMRRIAMKTFRVLLKDICWLRFLYSA